MRSQKATSHGSEELGAPVVENKEMTQCLISTVYNLNNEAADTATLLYDWLIIYGSKTDT